MSAQETEMHPLKALEAVEREFAAGNYVESSRILWKATEATYAMMAKAHGLHTGDLNQIADALDRKYGGNDRRGKGYYSGYLITCGLMRDHAEMEALEEYELDWPSRRLMNFIRECYRKFENDDTSR